MLLKTNKKKARIPYLPITSPPFSICPPRSSDMVLCYPSNCTNHVTQNEIKHLTRGFIIQCVFQITQRLNNTNLRTHSCPGMGPPLSGTSCCVSDSPPPLIISALSVVWEAWWCSAVASQREGVKALWRFHVCSR